uniref:Uncharacterized protein LOC110218859 n=1 Tax=Phascolarctos cinereus TaxID=38626 RepID=A0A6P5LH96_PHACI|nr:uncharacterized protein LOC110218859 [Phascolarctos cinereus]
MEILPWNELEEPGLGGERAGPEPGRAWRGGGPPARGLGRGGSEAAEEAQRRRRHLVVVARGPSSLASSSLPSIAPLSHPNAAASSWRERGNRHSPTPLEICQETAAYFLFCLGGCRCPGRGKKGRKKQRGGGGGRGAGPRAGVPRATGNSYPEDNLMNLILQFVADELITLSANYNGALGNTRIWLLYRVLSSNLASEINH